MGGELRALAAVFLKLGTIGFGGPAAHVAMTEDEVVRRRKWLTPEEFMDLLGATQLIPGPNSTELAIHIGWRRAGLAGLLVAGACFILPAMAIVWALAWAYGRYGSLPAVEGILAGIKPVVFAIVMQALTGLARTALKSAVTLAVGVTAFIALMMGVHELAVLALAGAITWVDARVIRGGDPLAGTAIALPVVVNESMPRVMNEPVSGAAIDLAPHASAPFALGSFATTAAAAAATLGGLALAMLKAGAFLFGSGYVLLAFLRADLVTRHGWLTESQLLDAIAVGQMTPGPVFTTATFVGYLVQGHMGALVATAGIFLPAFVFVAITAPLVKRLSTNHHLRGILDGVNVASLALMAAVCFPLGRAALSTPLTVVTFLVALVLLVHNRVW